MTKEHFKATGNGGSEELAQDKKPMSETEILKFMAGKTKYGYPATRL